MGTNSLAHTKWNCINHIVFINEIAIFSNRIEIYNPGTFPEGLSPEDYINGDAEENGGSGQSDATPQVTPQVMQLIDAMEGEMARTEIQKGVGLSDRKHLNKRGGRVG